MFQDNFKSYLTPEIKLVGELFSPRFFKTSFNSQRLFQNFNPDILLAFLKQHRLYSAWNRLQIPGVELGDEKWQAFRTSVSSLSRSNNFQMLQKTAVLVKVMKAFEESNIPVLSIKGPVQSKVIFDDYAVKASIDLDILINLRQFEDAVNALKRSGFVQAYLQYELNKHQREYLLNHFHHLRFFHPEEKLMLELHWQLNTNKYLLNFSFEQLYNEAVSINIGGQKIKTLGGENLIIHLASHGAQHAWSRLDWLYEFSVELYKCQSEIIGLRQEFNRHGLHLLFNFSMHLCNEVFKTEFPADNAEKKTQYSMMKYCAAAIINPQLPDYTRPWERIKNKMYQSGFKNGFRYKAQVWMATRTNIIDWASLRLPENLFFLYYFVRPVMMIVSLFRKNRKYLSH